MVNFTVKILKIIFFLFIFTNGYSQDAPYDYTTNYRLRQWNHGSRPSADSLNQNTRDIDRYLYTVDSLANKLLNRTINGHPLTSDVELLVEDISNFDDGLLDPRDFAIGQVLKVGIVEGDTVFIGANDSVGSGGTGGVDTTVKELVFSISYSSTVYSVRKIYSNISSFIIDDLSNNGTGLLSATLNRPLGDFTYSYDLPTVVFSSENTESSFFISCDKVTSSGTTIHFKIRDSSTGALSDVGNGDEFILTLKIFPE